MLAVALLAAAAGIMIGLQGASIERTMYDQKSWVATLAARQILSAIEIREDDFGDEGKSGTVLNLFNEFNVPLPEDEKEKTALDLLQANLTVKDWSIPGINSARMKRIILEISWNDQPEDRVEMLYFIPVEN